jgi:hypothetical protein
MSRIDDVVADALEAIHAVLERHQVTEQEWHAALALLTDIGRADEFILLSDVTRTSVLIDAITHGDENGATASDVQGPLYADDPPWREAPPLPDAVIDIWQTGPNGGYDFKVDAPGHAPLVTQVFFPDDPCIVLRPAA